MMDQIQNNSKIFRVSSLLEFNRLKKGKFFRSDTLWFKYILDNENDSPFKLSVAVSKKYGNAVKRNLIKRRIKNAFYMLSDSQNIPRNFIVMIGVDRDVTSEISFEQIYDSVEKFLTEISKSNFLKGDLSQ